MYPLHADNFPTTAMTSTDADTPTTITTTSTPTDYSFVSDGVSSASSVVPTVVGVLSFLMVFVGLLVAATVAVLCLYRKRKSKKRRYIHYRISSKNSAFLIIRHPLPND